MNKRYQEDNRSDGTYRFRQAFQAEKSDVQKQGIFLGFKGHC